MRMDQHIKRMIEKYTIEASRLSGLEALDKYNMAYAQAMELGNDFTLRACAANLGAMYVSLGQKDDVEKGIDYLKRAIPPRGTIDCASNGDLYFNIALGFEVLRQFRDAGRYYEEALKEYRGERDNLNMEIDTLKRLVQNSITRTNEEEVIMWYKQLEETYGHANKLIDQLLVMVQRITRHKQLASPGNKELEAELETDVDQCCELLDTIKEREKNSEQPATNRVMTAVSILVQVSVLLTQLKKLEKARQLLNDALTLFEAEDGLTVQKAVVLQNLGTVCNYLQDWDSAIPYHKQAAAIYHHCANMPSDPNSYLTAVSAQRCQGHCLAGHAFALVNLDDIDEARVLFDKARDLAVNSGDKDTVWQMDEALGAVHFMIACHELDLDTPLTATTRVQLTESLLEHLDKSILWYKMALEDLATSPRRSQSVLDRVLDKYTQVQMFRKNTSKAPPGVIAQVYAPRAPPDNVTGDSSEVEDEEEEQVEEKFEENKEENVVEGESEKRLTKTLRFPAEENDDDNTSDGSSDDDDDEDSDDNSSDGSDEAVNRQPEARDAGDDDDDLDETQVIKAYRQQLGTETLTVSGVQTVVKADVHAQAPPGVIAQVYAPRAPPDNVTGDSSKVEDEEEEQVEEKFEENKEENVVEGESEKRLTKTLRFPAEENDDDNTSDGSSDDDDDEDSDDNSSDGSDEAVNRQPEARDAGDDDDDLDETQVIKAYRQQLGTETLTVSGVQTVVKADVHAQHQERNYSSSAESGTTDEDSDGSSASQEDYHVGRQVPKLPSLSPPATTTLASGTYETPQEAEMHINELYGSESHSRPQPTIGGNVNYAHIDVDRGRQGTSGELDRQQLSNNFFISSSDDEKDGTEMTSKKKPEGSRQDPDYEPVNVRQDIKSPEPVKKDPSGKSKVCSIM